MIDFIKGYVAFIIAVLAVSVLTNLVRADTYIEVIDKDPSLTYRLYLPTSTINSPTGIWAISGDWPVGGQDVSLSAIKEVDNVEYESEKLTVHIDTRRRPQLPKEIKVNFSVDLNIE